MNEPRIEYYYFIRYAVPGKKKMSMTRWKMTEAEAAKRYAGIEWEIVPSSKEKRVIDGDPLYGSMSHFQDGMPKKST